MPVIAVVNPKGGSGKSTLATHLAGHAARLGLQVMLGDADRQKSTLVWLRRRAGEPAAADAPILSWMIDSARVLRPPQSVTHVVLDTPAGFCGPELARAVMSADAILMPVCDSAFDRDALAHCWAELQALPRVASGRCRVAAVGMRIDTRTRDDNRLRQWAESLGLPFLGVLRDTKLYVRCIERGLTLFDLPAARTDSDRAQWQAILGWLDPLWSSRDGTTPSQAGALTELAEAAPALADVPKIDAEGRIEPVPVRVTPGPRRAAADPTLVAALKPRPAAAARGWFAQTLGWISGAAR